MMKKTVFLLLLLSGFLYCKSNPDTTRNILELKGKWQFALDTAKKGNELKWYNINFTDSVNLPGTTDSNHKGFRNKDTTTFHLNRIFIYEGVAWYRKKIVIPESFRGKHIELTLERTKSTMVWIDSILVGSSNILLSPQQYELTNFITPGIHYITIRVDNSLNLTPYGSVHLYSDDTQTNWNGIIGAIKLEAFSKTYISDLQVYPDIENKKIAVKIRIENGLKLKNMTVELHVSETKDEKAVKLKVQKNIINSDSVVKLNYYFDKDCAFWDEYQQPIYNLTAVIYAENVADSKTTTFGMRKFSIKNTQFDINGRTTFLRGKHEACVFPLTGYPPMEVAGWLRVFKIAKSYGINHYRFHTYCPPEAAFIAADQEGIYLEPELPFWGGLDSDTIAEMLKKEGIGILKTYGNHPSFVMFSMGNEIWGGHQRVEKNITALKDYDSRPLYTMGANNNIGYQKPYKNSDFFIGARTPVPGDSTQAHVRLIHCFADAKNGGIINTVMPSTEINYSYSVSRMNLPIISHEIGQYQIFPDYKEIDKYTGVLRAWNFEVFRNRLKKAGMLDQDIEFKNASGAWAAICYKAEMEALLRTKGMAGFQLLDLQDYPGQGTALVGILDAFMDSKNVISKQEWLQSCNDIVLLLEFPKYCWTNDESFEANINVANYSNQVFKGPVQWKISNAKGEIIAKGEFGITKIEKGGINQIGKIKFALSQINKAEKLKVELYLKGSTYSNSYPVWVYTKINKPVNTDGIVIARGMTNEVKDQLAQGASVLYFPSEEEVKEKSVKGLFPCEFWNYGMFKSISENNKAEVSPGTLGLLTNPSHPIFNSFPTDAHTNWQWFSIVKASNPLILDHTASQYRPIVQVIDNLERNHKLGLIFEFRFGKGKLLVCMADLSQILDRPEAATLYTSIVNYMKSKDFNPLQSLTEPELAELF
jgi:hypothetical protein